MLFRNTRETLLAVKEGDRDADTLAYATVARTWSPTSSDGAEADVTVTFWDVLVDMSPMEETARASKDDDIGDVYAYCGETREWMKLGSGDATPCAELCGFEIPDVGKRYSYSVCIDVRLGVLRATTDGDDECVCHSALALARQLLLSAFPGAILYIPFPPMVSLCAFRGRLREDATYDKLLGATKLHGDASVARDETGQVTDKTITVYLTVEDGGRREDGRLAENYLSDEEKWLLECKYDVDDGQYKYIHHVKRQTIDEMETNFLGASATRLPNFTQKHFGFLQFLLQTIEECISKKH